MTISKDEFSARARSLGFDDVRFTHADGFLAFSEQNRIFVRKSLASATCIIVLFASYLPSEAAPPGFMPLSAYNAISNAAYHAAKKLAEELGSYGAAAVHDTHLPAKAAALRTGGFIGDNGLYYHGILGSFVCIQTILTDAFAPEDYPESQNRCFHCGSCKNACPSNAVGHLDRCLRESVNTLMPEEMRGSIYQLFGCERCQSACPLNRRGTSAAHLFDLEALLNGTATAHAKELAGSNCARTGRLASQAALYAANTGQRQLIPLLLKLSQTAQEPVRTHALWAYRKLNGEELP